MDERQISIFLEVAECGSFSKAEQTLYCSKQALKKHLDNLENNLGFKLFYRSNKGITLTNEGSLFYAEMSRIVREIAQLKESCLITATSQKNLRIIDMEQSFISVSGLMGDYLSNSPHVRAKLSHANSYTESFDLLKNSMADILCGYETDDEIAEDLSFVPVTEFGCCCVVSKWHELAEHNSVDASSLISSTVGVKNIGRCRQVINLLNSISDAVNIVEWTKKEDISDFMINLCFNNGVFITYTSPEFFSLDSNLCAVPLAHASAKRYGFYCRTKADAHVENFIGQAKEYFAAHGTVPLLRIYA